MKINEMTGGEGKKIIVTGVFFFFYLCGVWCVVCVMRKKIVVLKNKMIKNRD